MLKILFIFIVFIHFTSSATVKEIPQFHPLEPSGSGSAADGQFPYLVSLQLKGQGHQCGGSVVNRRWILTAAHCVSLRATQRDVSKLQILVGTKYLDQGGTLYNITKKIVHENYEYSINKNDIALLQTNSNIKFNTKVSAIPLATSEVPTGSRVISGGWRDSYNLQFIKMQTIDLVTCQYNFPHIEIFNSNICTLATRGQGTCLGDSGGPLVYNNELVGVLSWGEKCGGPAPEIYSKVIAFRAWIDRKIIQ